MMNALTRLNPFHEIDDMQRHVNSWLDWDPFRRGTLIPEEREIMASEWTPVVDIVEDDKEYLIKAELPEVEKKDVKVTVEDGILMISGERKEEKEEKGRKFHRLERFHGSFERRFSIPEDANPGKVSAEFKDGLLQVHLAKGEKPQPKEIDVKIG